MADSLDDFFAKKDKKRGKDKGKAALSAEALVRELEEGSKQVEYPIRKENKTSTAIELLGLDADDADWRDFEDVEKRDYTGLRVKEMSLQDQNEEEQRRLSSEQTDPTPESTPWKLKDEPSSSSADAASSANKQANKGDPELKRKSDAKTVSSSTDQTAADAATAEHTCKELASDEPSSTEKKGDNESAKEKKSLYIAPGSRNKSSAATVAADSEFKVLNPIKLSKTKGTGTGPNAVIPNLQDTQVFPSLG